jgi:hypothetical protein
MSICGLGSHSLILHLLWPLTRWKHIKVVYIIMLQIVGLSIIGHATKYKWIICEKDSKKNITCDMITFYEFHEYILNYHNILDFWKAKNLMSPSISYDYELIIFTIMFNWMNFFYIESSVMPLIQKKTNLKDFENHKFKYTMKYGFIHLN